MVWVRLSASAGTEMMGCGECSGSPFAEAVCACHRYRAAEDILKERSRSRQRD